MFNLIPISLLIGAIGGIWYIASNHLSEFNNEEEKNDVFGFNFRERVAQYVNQLPLDNIKSQSLSLTKKTLHRFRLTLLKTDNYLLKLTSKISQRDKTVNIKSNENGNIPDFWENVANGSENEKQIITPASDFVQPTAEPVVKIDFTLKNEAAKKYFDIKPSEVSLKISESKPAKKSLKTKKLSK